MKMGDAPAVGRSLIPMALPALGCERLSIGLLRGEHKIVDDPGGIARHDDADVAGLNIPLRKLLHHIVGRYLFARCPSP